MKHHYLHILYRGDDIILRGKWRLEKFALFKARPREKEC